jgi:hypothetical protein
MRRWGTGGSRGESSGGRSGGWTGKATSGGVTAYWKHRESLTKTISGKSRGNLTIPATKIGISGDMDGSRSYHTTCTQTRMRCCRV